MSGTCSARESRRAIGRRVRWHRLLATALGATMAAAPAAAQETSAPQTPVVITRGEATLRRTPDQAIVVVAVVTRARSPREAQQQNATAMASVQQRLAALGIPKDAVRTLGYSVQPEFDFPDGRRVARGYAAHNAIEVTLSAVDRAGEVLDAAVQVGATSVEGVRFELKDRAGAEREALRLAVVDARARAEAAAAGAGRALDRVMRIDDSRQPQIRMPMMMAAEARAGGQTETPVVPGMVEVRADVVLTVSLK